MSTQKIPTSNSKNFFSSMISHLVIGICLQQISHYDYILCITTQNNLSWTNNNELFFIYRKLKSILSNKKLPDKISSSGSKSNKRKCEPTNHTDNETSKTNPAHFLFTSTRTPRAIISVPLLLLLLLKVKLIPQHHSRQQINISQAKQYF